MNKKPLLAIGGVGLLALAVTVGLFLAGDRGSTEPKIVGKLSKKSIEFEARYRELQEKWRTHQDDFRVKKEFQLLAKLNDGFTALSHEVPGLKGETEEEKAALPHLAKSVEESAKVPSTFMMLQVNEGLLKDSDWAQAKAHADAANREWKEWEKLTEGLSR